MKLQDRSVSASTGFCVASLLFGVLLFMSGCGGSSGSVSTNPANTNVTVLITGTANDQLAGFYISIASLTLSDNQGKSVTLLDNPGAQANPPTGPSLSTSTAVLNLWSAPQFLPALTPLRSLRFRPVNSPISP